MHPQAIDNDYQHKHQVDECADVDVLLFMRFLIEQYLVDSCADETPYEEYHAYEPLRREQPPEEPAIGDQSKTTQRLHIVCHRLVFALVINKLTQFFCTTRHTNKHIDNKQTEYTKYCFHTYVTE